MASTQFYKKLFNTKVVSYVNMNNFYFWRFLSLVEKFYDLAKIQNQPL